MTSAVSPYLKMEELQIAAVLDPRFKLNFLLDEDTAPVKVGFPFTSLNDFFII